MPCDHWLEGLTQQEIQATFRSCKRQKRQKKVFRLDSLEEIHPVNILFYPSETDVGLLTSRILI